MEQVERTVISSSSPFEVLSLAEHTLGFRPRESLLVVALRPPRWRTGVVGRVDVAAADHPEVVDALVRQVVADGARRCFVALVTDAGAPPAPARPQRRERGVVPAPRGSSRDARAVAPLTGLLRLPGDERAERVCEALVAAGVEPEPWLVHRGRLYSYACDRACCPAEGLSLDRLGSTRVAAEMVLAGRVLPVDRDVWERGLRRAVAAPVSGGSGGSGGPGGPVGPRGPGDHDPEVAAALAGATRRARADDHRADHRADARTGDRAVRSTWLRALAEEAAAPGAGERLDPVLAADLLDGLRRLPLRDQLLAAAVPAALPELAETPATAVDPRAALAVLQQLARRAPAPWRAAATGCAAYVAWCSGAAPAAGVWAEAALELDPDHSLSALVLQAVSVGLPPPGREDGREHGRDDGAAEVRRSPGRRAPRGWRRAR